MEVSRIESITTPTIYWQHLTARKILDYRDQGIDVPNQYIAWAQSFIASINSDDNTTYEMATKNVSTNSSTTQDSTNDASSSTVDENTEEIPGEDNGNNSSIEEDDGEDKTEAQSLRESLENSGVGLFKQATIFRKISKVSSREAKLSEIIMNQISKMSDDEVAKLDRTMGQILSKIDTLQARQESITSGDIANKGIMAKLFQYNDIQKEIEKYGAAGQTMAFVSGMKFDEMGSVLDSESIYSAEAIDYGGETVDIGKDLVSLKHVISAIVGTITMHAGNKAINAGENAMQTYQESANINSSNQSNISSYQTELEDKTGVQAIELPKSDKNTEGDSTNETTAESTKPKETEKTEETESDEAKTDDVSRDSTDPALNTNFDKIILAKIRRGEYVEG